MPSCAITCWIDLFYALGFSISRIPTSSRLPIPKIYLCSPRREDLSPGRYLSPFISHFQYPCVPDPALCTLVHSTVLYHTLASDPLYSLYRLSSNSSNMTLHTRNDSNHIVAAGLHRPTPPAFRLNTAYHLYSLLHHTSKRGHIRVNVLHNISWHGGELSLRLCMSPSRESSCSMR